jgi:hypothetical protein
MARDQTRAGGHEKGKIKRHSGKVFKKIKEYSKKHVGKKFERNFRKKLKNVGKTFMKNYLHKVFKQK